MNIREFIKFILLIKPCDEPLKDSGPDCRAILAGAEKRNYDLLIPNLALLLMGLLLFMATVFQFGQ